MTTLRASTGSLARASAPGAWLSNAPTEVRQGLRRLSARDNATNLLFITQDWAIIAAAIAAVYLSGDVFAVYVMAVLLIGSRQRGLMNLLHEASHRKLFRSSALNDVAGLVVLGYPLLATLGSYRDEHKQHHSWLWVEGRDPKRARYDEMGLLPAQRPRFLARHLVRSLLLRNVPANLRAVTAAGWAAPGEAVGRLLFWMAIFAGAYALGWLQPLLLLWVVPFLTSFQVIRYWAEMAEHAGLEDNVHMPMLASRNWTSTPMVRWLVAPHSDDMYHLTHHLYPAVPHYRLKEAHTLLMTIPEYRSAHHCDGLIFPRSSAAPSVVQDILGQGRRWTLLPSHGSDGRSSRRDRQLSTNREASS